ncbi:N2227-domain-containing protein [Durotheca rogersii]|uniref:N2227-domain-containing protein n=1 Tax=Durotheca rogersii TaxID=419775 RepID=UPI002220FD4B|nr:N2227-domain-containing protein [Durotheca rogersii]KAI5867175.1 N2227-domain-containing protein [Durotheca rogersii]
MESVNRARDDNSQWSGVEETSEDPEEIRVIFCALDSFRSVLSAYRRIVSFTVLPAFFSRPRPPLLGIQYAKTAHLNCTHLRRQAFYALPQAHWQLLAQPPFSYLDMLSRIDDAIECNAELARIIVKAGLRSFGVASTTSGEEPTMPEEWSGIAKYNDLDKARSIIRQFYRDWSTEGAIERDACYGPVYDVLQAERAKRNDGVRMKVLVPGAGLGRLVFDLCRLGYESEGNEISYHQLLASSYILNWSEQAGQHTIYPWIHSFSNHQTRENQFRAYKIPDIHPQTTLASTQGIGSMQMCAADFLCLYGDEGHRDSYDAVAAVFFLDTAPNLIRYLEVIRSCLKPGGVLINVGPLLWHWENHVPGHHGYDGDGDYDESSVSGIAEPGSFELTDDEVVALVERMGFVVEKREKGLHAPYVQDAQSMLQMVYKASHWVVRKPVAAAEPGTGP